MKHFVCTGGCGGESSVTKVCESEICVKEGETLTLCECEDGLHNAAFEKDKDGDEDGDEEKYDE